MGTALGRRRTGRALLGGAVLGALAVAAAGTQGSRALESSAGLALRAGVRAAERGELEEADRRLAAAAAAHPEIADVADRLRVRVLLEGGRPVDAVAIAEEGLARQPEGAAQSALLRQLGDAYLVVGAEAAARDAWGRALEGAPEPAERAALLLARAASFERAARPQDAAEDYRELWVRHPEQAGAVLAGERLAVLEAREGTLRSAADRLERARILLARYRNEEALAASEEALALELAPEERSEGLRLRAEALFRLRRYPEAARAYAALRDDPEARIQHARAVARAGDPERAVRELEELGRVLPPAPAERARHLAALLLEASPPDPRALHRFAELAEHARDPGIQADSRWRLAWAAYQEGRFPEGLAHLEALEADLPDPLERLQARYWRARSLEGLGDPAARRLLEELAAEYPLSYYGWRAAARLGFPDLVAPLREPPGAGPARLRPRELERVRSLVVAGLDAEARAEIGRLGSGRLGFADRLELAALAAEAGDPNRAQRLVVDAYNEELARGPRPGLEELWWLAWPWLYPGRPEGSGVDPELVHAVMREESGYRPDAVSVAGARGLLQIMPETGSRLARDLGLAGFDAADLFDPALNLRLGSHYLGELESRFGARASAAIGGYNAGPEAVERWLAERGSLEDDEWVETIPYAQTRSYVKRVLRSRFAYDTLY
jgi:soluble lytic murein transglycosylase